MNTDLITKYIYSSIDAQNNYKYEKLTCNYDPNNLHFVYTTQNNLANINNSSSIYTFIDITSFDSDYYGSFKINFTYLSELNYSRCNSNTGIRSWTYANKDIFDIFTDDSRICEYNDTYQFVNSCTIIERPMEGGTCDMQIPNGYFEQVAFKDSLVSFTCIFIIFFVIVGGLAKALFKRWK